MRYFEEWTIAYRKRQGNELLMDNQDNEFRIIPNTWRYWCADPHLIEHDRRNYIFAEMYDRVLRRGVIGCCEITDAGCTPWKVVLKMPWHLSYPHLIVRNNTVYMIPESYAGNEIAVYKTTSFPLQWEKVRVLKSNCIAVDSTLFFAEGQYWLQTMEFEDDQAGLFLYSIKNRELSDNRLLIAKNDDNIRPAGNIFLHNGKLIRPTQDCSESYGCALNFCQIADISKSNYKEVLIAKIKPSSIRLDSEVVPQGIHTYNANDKYEVIDIKENKVDLWSYIMRPIWFVWRRIKRVFGR